MGEPVEVVLPEVDDPSVDLPVCRNTDRLVAQATDNIQSILKPQGKDEKNKIRASDSSLVLVIIRRSKYSGCPFRRKFKVLKITFLF
jgi:hypothetical protein